LPSQTVQLYSTRYRVTQYFFRILFIFRIFRIFRIFQLFYLNSKLDVKVPVYFSLYH
jgi:hypothetical protein